jgi:hypothetical protein
MTNEAAARQLGWPAGSMSARLARGRELLRERLQRRTRRFLAPIPFALWLSGQASASPVPAGLAVRAGKPSPSDPPPPGPPWWRRRGPPAAVAAVVLAALLAAAGFGSAAPEPAAAGDDRPPPAVAVPPAAAAAVVPVPVEIKMCGTCGGGGVAPPATGGK